VQRFDEGRGQVVTLGARIKQLQEKIARDPSVQDKNDLQHAITKVCAHRSKLIIGTL
jgi:hypothetical protein